MLVWPRAGRLLEVPSGQYQVEDVHDAIVVDVRRHVGGIEVVHHRPVGTADGKSVLRARFEQGLTEYGVATHPVFMLAKSFRRAFLEKPYFTASLTRLAGFVYGYWLREERKIPHEAIRFVRREQIRRLLSCVCSP